MTSRLTTGTGAGAAALEIIAGTLKGCWLRSIDFTLAAATASLYAIGRPAAKGVTPTTPLGFLIPESGDPVPSTVTATTALAWATPPTVPAAFYKQVSLPATVGAASPQWVFDKLFIPLGQTLVLWNLALNSAAYVNIVIDE